MAVSTRQGLIDYCLRELGHPVVEINVDEDQVNDRIDQAFQYYQDYHYDAVQRVYFKYQVTSTVATLTTAVADTFEPGETITGQTSQASAKVFTTSTGTALRLDQLVGTFVDGETIVGSVTSSNAVIESVKLGDRENGYINIPDSIINVVRVLPFTDTNTGMDFMFDLRYQLRLNDLFDLLSTSIIYYEQVKAHLSLIEHRLVGEKTVEFSRHTNHLYLNMAWNKELNNNEYLIIEGYRILDPNEFTDVYNDWFLKHYATALIKKQWGTNLKKFSGIQMPGGVTLNGQQIYDEAIQEIRQLEEDMQNRYTAPPNFFIG